MKTRLIVTLALLVQLIFPFQAGLAQTTTAPANIHLQSSTFDPLGEGEPLLTAAATASNTPASPYYLVQFNGTVQPLWIEQIEALGGHVLGYVPDNTHIVRLSAPALGNVRSLPAVRWIGNYRPDYKLSPALSNSLNAASGLSEVYVAAFAGESLADLQTALIALQATILEANESPIGPLVRAILPSLALNEVLQNPAVSWVEPYLPMALANAEGRKIMNAETVWQEFGYYGEGQIVAVSDSGLSVQGSLSADFNGRLLKAFAPSDMNLSSQQCSAKTTFTDLHGHGTHVAGSVLGNGSKSGSNATNHQYSTSHAGVAPEAQLIFMALNTDGSSSIQCIDTNGDFLARGYQNGARISSNSWGASDSGGYNLIASIVDNYIWQHKDYLVLYAAGNAGPNAQTVGSPGTAKNILTVGASENNRPTKDELGDNPNQVATFSSRGPTTDGRVKPDVVAPGTWILSVKAAQAPVSSFWEPFNDDYAFMGGTSMATPLTAGGSALVREWLSKQRGISNPSAALMKAVLINGAVPLPAAAIADMNSGYGRVDLKNTLRSNYVVMDDFVQGLSNSQSVSYTLQVVTNSQQGLVVATAGMAENVEIQAADTLHLTDRTPLVTAAQSVSDPAQFTVEALPSSQKASNLTPIPTGRGKAENSLLAGPRLTNPLTATFGTGNNPAFQSRQAGQSSTQSYLYNFVGGGNFEDPDWTDYWQAVWLGSGVPLRTADPNYVINGGYSMWLGGTATQDSIWYPLQFPDRIDSSKTSSIQFDFDTYDQDTGFDAFCVALVDASGYFIGPYAPDQPNCTEADGKYTYRIEFSPTDLLALAGQTGYLVLYTVGDGSVPHQSAFVDDIVLAVDLPSISLEPTPAFGPPGTTFLLAGKYYIPYSWVNICVSPCNEDNYIKTVYADAAGNMAAFLYSSTTITPGQYPIDTVDVGARSGKTELTISGDGGDPTLSVTPQAGVAGTEFVFTGNGFVPNDEAINITVGGETIGSVGSDSAGQVSFSIKTAGNSAAGNYTAVANDSANNSASTQFTVNAIAGDKPTVTVTPTLGVAGSTFTFQARNFTPSSDVELRLDNQKIGTAKTDNSGKLQVTIDTLATTQPGQYSLSIVQGDQQASAQYTVSAPDGGGGNPATGGVNVTLVWSDPPAQTAASKKLVNDLDLTIASPSGLLFASAANAADHANNVEVIRLANPALGTYIITVAATSINGQFGAQPFALVATRDYTSNSTANVALGGGNLNSQKVFLPLVGR